MSTKDPEPGFASRWSRLKQEAREEEPGETPPAEADAPAPQEDARTDAEVLEELGLPDPDSLKPGDDIRGFMAKAVPARLRNRALRKLWISNPVLANLDELVDYGEDYTDAATVLENLQTAYQVGKGWADKFVETPKSPAHAESTEPEASAEPASDEQVASGEDAPETAAPDDEASGAQGRRVEAGSDVAPPVIAADAPPLIPRKRMRFRIAED
ncbi:MAG: DUF3306 domain-containing protein [Paracoccaceae bacterium]|nr:DUF3306 domain-containing protein [Paracoccaceae bacterium]